jgi:hypothetical protein
VAATLSLAGAVALLKYVVSVEAKDPQASPEDLQLIDGKRRTWHFLMDSLSRRCANSRDDGMTDHLIDQARDVYCHKLQRIDHVGPDRSLIFAVPDLQSCQWQQVVVKLIMPAEVMAALARPPIRQGQVWSCWRSNRGLRIEGSRTRRFTLAGPTFDVNQQSVREGRLSNAMERGTLYFRLSLIWLAIIIAGLAVVLCPA